MTAFASSLLLGIVLAAAMIGHISGRERARGGRPTWLVSAALLACLLAQLTWPGLLLLLRRDAGAVDHGQIYRLVTSLWVQDGGFTGGVFNLAMLVIVGTAAERFFAPSMWLLLYLAGGLGAELLALSWQPIGAGNSVAYMSLAGGLLGHGIVLGRSRSAALLGAAGLVAGLVLCLREDIHGAAVLIGGGIAVLSRLAPVARRFASGG